MSKFQLLLKGSSLRVLQTVVGIVVGFLMMPFLIGALGEETYGVWVVVSSVAATFYLLDAGFSSAVTRFSAKYIQEERHDEANAIISTALAIYGILGLVVLLVSVLLAGYGVGSVLEQEQDVGLVQILLIIFGIQLALEFPAKALPGVINAYMRYGSIAVIRSIKLVLDGVLTWIAISNGFGLIAMALVCLSTSVLSTACYVWVVKSLYADLEISRQLINRKIFKDIFHFSKWVFVFDVSAMLKQKIDVWLVAFYLGPASLTVYYVAVRLTEYAVRFMLQATDMSTPMFIEYHSKGDKQKLSDALSRFIRVGIFLALLGFVGFYVVGESFISLWMPNDFDVTLAWQLLMVLAVARFAVYVTTPLQSMLLTLHRHELSAMISALELVACTGLGFYLVPLYGLMGAAIAMTAPVVLSRGVIFPWVLQRMVPFLRFGDILRVIVICVLAIVISLALAEWLAAVSWKPIASLLVGGAISVVFMLGASPLLMRSNELKVLRDKVRLVTN